MSTTELCREHHFIGHMHGVTTELRVVKDIHLRRWNFTGNEQTVDYWKVAVIACVFLCNRTTLSRSNRISTYNVDLGLSDVS